MRYDPVIEHASFAVGGQHPVRAAIADEGVALFLEDVRDLQRTFTLFAAGIEIDLLAQVSVLALQPDTKRAVALVLKFEQSGAQVRVLLDLDENRPVVEALARGGELTLVGADGYDALLSGGMAAEMVSMGMPESVIETLGQALALPGETWRETETGWVVGRAEGDVGAVEVRTFATTEALEAAAARASALGAAVEVQGELPNAMLGAAGFVPAMASFAAEVGAVGTPCPVPIHEARALWRGFVLGVGRQLAAAGELPGARPSPEIVVRRAIDASGPPGVPVFFAAFGYTDDATSRAALERVHEDVLDGGRGGYVRRMGFGDTGDAEPTTWVVMAVTHDQFHRDRLFLFDWGEGAESVAQALSEEMLGALVDRIGEGIRLVPFAACRSSAG